MDGATLSEGAGSKGYIKAIKSDAFQRLNMPGVNIPLRTVDSKGY